MFVAQSPCLSVLLTGWWPSTISSRVKSLNGIPRLPLYSALGTAKQALGQIVRSADAYLSPSLQKMADGERRPLQLTLTRLASVDQSTDPMFAALLSSPRPSRRETLGGQFFV